MDTLTYNWWTCEILLEKQSDNMYSNLKLTHLSIDCESIIGNIFIEAKDASTQEH